MTIAARCRECEIEEIRNPVFRLIARALWQLEENRRARDPFANLGRNMGALLGARNPETPHVKRHENEYVRTGDSNELARMLRLTK